MTDETDPRPDWVRVFFDQGNSFEKVLPVVQEWAHFYFGTVFGWLKENEVTLEEYEKVTEQVRDLLGIRDKQGVSGVDVEQRINVVKKFEQIAKAGIVPGKDQIYWIHADEDELFPRIKVYVASIMDYGDLHLIAEVDTKSKRTKQYSFFEKPSRLFSTQEGNTRVVPSLRKNR